MTPISDDMVERAAAEMEPLAFAVDDEGEFWCADSARVTARERARDVLTAALEGSVAVPAWQPIETAPKDDSDILVGAWGSADGFEPEPPEEWFQVISSREDRPLRRGYRHRNGARWATHWHPLPDAGPLPRHDRLPTTDPGAS